MPQNKTARLSELRVGLLVLLALAILILVIFAVSGDLTSGSVTVLSSLQSVGVKTLAGEIVNLSAGETATATSTSSTKAAKPGPGGLDWWVWGAIITGAIVVVIVVATSGDDNPSPSPVR